MSEQPLSQDIGATKINIPPEYLEKINLQIKEALETVKGLIEETQESMSQKKKVFAALNNPEFIEWATNRGQELFTSQDENPDSIKNNLAREIASKALRWPE